MAVAVIVLGALSAAAAPSPGVAQGGRCAPAGSTTVQRSAEVRVFRLRSKGQDSVYACHLRTGRRLVVGSAYRASQSSSGGGGVVRLRVAGRFVAVASVSVDGAGGRTAGVEVFDVRRRRKTYDYTAGGETNLAIDADVTDLVVDRAGRVAFIAGFVGPARGERPQRLLVRRHDRRGDAVLEDSSAVAPRSLSLSGRTLRWRSGSSVRTATLR